jgi:NADH-quinone oxidoreductase subunit C/D
MSEAAIAKRGVISAEETLRQVFSDEVLKPQSVCDGIPTLWVARERIEDVLSYLKSGITNPYSMLYDLSAIDERVRANRAEQPPSDFTVFYQLLSFERNEDLRLKVALRESDSVLPTIRHIYPNADWYEREIWDLFGIRFTGHPHLKRILLPPTWEGHPLRKDHPARATEMGLFALSEEKQVLEQEALRFRPEEWGMRRRDHGTDFMFLNLGPNHPSAHGVFRVVLQLDGEEIVDAVPDIGYHHRGAEKMGERQSWHTYIPYTDRIDYLCGVLNNLPYVLAAEQLASIEVPLRAQVIRVMLCEIFRVCSHLLFLGTMAQDLGQVSPIFYMFSDRQRAYDIIEAICGFRMHPGWFRIRGVAQDLPKGWDSLVRRFIGYLSPRLKEYENMVLKNGLFRRRTRQVGNYTTEEAIYWGITGPGLCATGLEWDYRKIRPYSGYDKFDFDIPTGQYGDCFDRTWVRLEEMRQSLRIVEQCVNHMPSGDYKARHPLTTPPIKERTLHDIETLITHFLNVSWGPVIAPGEASVRVEAARGLNSYYLISDGGTVSYRTRIRTPSFAHLQMIPLISRGFMVADLVAILGSIDFVMADVDR